MHKAIFLTLPLGMNINIKLKLYKNYKIQMLHLHNTKEGTYSNPRKPNLKK